MPAATAKASKTGDVAERSPTVISANLKEDILLGKQVHVLNRSEKSVVHRIKVEQKVMYRQFQSRLVRSKLAMARIMCNKALEKELRSKNLGGLHTDVVAEEDYAFLAKLEHRPCTATQYTPPYREISRKRGNNPAIQRQNSTNHNSSTTGQRSAPQFLLRASTTIGATPLHGRSKEGENLEKKPVANDKRLLSSDKYLETNGRQQLESNLVKRSYSNTQNEIAVNEKPGKSVRPKTVTIVTQTPDTTPLPSPRQYSRRTSRAADFFEEDKKIDLVELRLKAARGLDYTDRVMQFCGELVEMASGHPQVDWYSMRLHSTQDPARKTVGLVDVIDEADTRAIGNVNVRSFTLPQLDLNFEGSDP